MLRISLKQAMQLMLFFPAIVFESIEKEEFSSLQSIQSIQSVE